MRDLCQDLASRYVHRVDRFDETVASYERLGFEQVRAWAGEGEARSALFKTGPALLEVVETGLRSGPDPRSIAAWSSGVSSR